MLNIYGKYLKGKNDLRWRIEHAQVINENDFKLFGEYNIVPSVQPTHATSDMYWAGDRLGPERVKGAYAYKQLLEQNGWIPLGTDFPVEDISPFKTFYAAVVRKDAKGWPANGFQMENALTREEALRGMTIWAAKANFEETEKGSLEKGKFADFVILDNDLVKEVPGKLLQVKVLKTFVGGEKVYERK
jgi:predicted amidohydrolase YtcJ